MAGKSKKPVTVYGAMIANFVIAATKFAAALFTGSSAMLSEGIHSAVDTGNQSLLLLGINLSKKPADESHPFGHGKELYFWGLVVAIILFGLGGGMSIYEGITHLQHPSELGDPLWNYAVLGIAFIAEGISFSIALREFLHTKGKEPFWQAIHTSKDPSIFVILFEDFAALTGLIIAALGVFLAHAFQNPVYDGSASILIGILLGTVAIFLAYESRLLLLGESAARETVEGIRDLAERQPNVHVVRLPHTMQLGPDEILLNLSVQFSEGLSGQAMVQAVDSLEKSIQKEFPTVKHVFIEAEAITKTNLTESDKQGKEVEERHEHSDPTNSKYKK